MHRLRKAWPWDYFRHRKPKVYRCRNCGYELPADDVGTKVPISGYDSQSSLRHIHCPKCGKKIDL